jgi:hypothetical protein
MVQKRRTGVLVRRLLYWPLSLLFLYSGTIKLFRLSDFAQSVGDFGIVLDGLTRPVAFLVCCLEIALATVLWLQKSWAMLATATLLLCFSGVLLYGMAIGLDIECGCFGTHYRMTLKSQLIFDVALLCWCSFTHWALRSRRSESL